MIGQVLAERYQILSRIGEGGMAVVFLAKDLRTGHDVAVKFLRPEFRANPDFLIRFRREATAASKMTHHNIVNLLDVGGGNEQPYIVIEYVDGKTLKDIIRERKQLPQEVACQIAIRILSALQHAHQAGIIHRDIKPQNVLVNQKGYIKVSDFGIARMVGTNTATLTDAENTVMGSVHYFSPEQARGETATVLSDLYSVGVVLYEMLTGHVPFDGETSVAIALQHVQAKPRPVRELAPEVTPSVEAVVMQALEKDAMKRFHTALEMAQALKIALQSPEKEITLDTPVLSMENGKRPAAATRKQRIRERLVIAAASLLVLAVLGVGSYLIYQDVISRTRAPYVLHTMEQDARREIEKAGLKWEVARQSSVEPVGTVIGVSHDFDYPMKRGQTLLITVSSGPSQQKPVPQVEGLLYEHAKLELERLGLNLLQVGDPQMHPSRPGTILSQQPERGTMLDFGGIVQVTISGGEEVVPDLVGQLYKEQVPMLEKMGLTVNVEEVPMLDEAQAGRVAAQQPPAGTKVMNGHKVNLSVYVLAPTAVPSPAPSATASPAP